MTLMEHAFDDVQLVLQGFSVRAPSTEAAPAYTQRLLRESITKWIRRVTSLRVTLAGQHEGGISNQRLLAVRKREGRDYAHWTVQLKQELQRKSFDHFDAIKRIPSESELATFAAGPARDWLVKRVERGGLDIGIEKLSKTYAARKRRDGYGGKPVGVRKGTWLKALAASRVEFVY